LQHSSFESQLPDDIQYMEMEINKIGYA